MIMDLNVNWDEKKNDRLKKERGVCFEDVALLIMENEILAVFPHHNKKSYPNQKIFIFNIRGYVYYVPFVESSDEIFLKTIIPSRKYNNYY